MKTKLRNELVKVVNGLDRALEGSLADWVGAVREASLESKAAVAALKEKMATAMGTAEATHDFLRWFSTYHGKIVEGWGPWKRPAATEQERAAINTVFRNYLDTSTPVMNKLANREADVNAQTMTNVASILQDFNTLFLQLYSDLKTILSPYVVAYGAQQHIDAGEELGKQGRLDEAIAEFNEAIRLDSQDSNTYLSRGITYIGLRQYELAIQDYDEAIRLNPQDASGYKGRALARTRLVKDSEAQ